MREKIWILTLILILLILPMVIAEELNFNISVEGVSNISIKINTTDSEVRKDVYGIVGNSSTRDVSLHDPLFWNQTKIKEICEHATIFDLIGEMPPEEFVAYVKSLGYDDESHIAMIWTMCHEEYIKEHEVIWSIDRVGWGLTVENFIYYLRYAINWLTGNEPNPPEQSKELGRILSGYFASHREVDELKKELAMMNIRITALEKTMENISSEAYCRGKIETMLQYNLSWVKCGENSTYYYRVNPKNYQGYSMIAIRTVEPTIRFNETKKARPNVTIEKFQISDLKPGGVGVASMFLHNYGNKSGSVVVSVEVPKDWNLIPESVRLSLEPGETRKVAFAIFLPEDVKGGFYLTGYVSLAGKRHAESVYVEIKPTLTFPSLTGKLIYPHNFPLNLAEAAKGILPITKRIVGVANELDSLALDSLTNVKEDLKPFLVTTKMIVSTANNSIIHKLALMKNNLNPLVL